MCKMNQNNHLEDIIFDEEKVMLELKKMKNGTEKITFINEVLLLRKKKKEYYDPEKYSDEPTLDDKLNNILQQITEETSKGTTKKIKTEYDLDELIWWKGSATTLLYLFELLYEARLIDDRQYEKERSSLLEKHFKNENGNKFENETLNKTFSRMRDDGLFKKPKKEDAERIEDVVIEIRNLLKR